VRAVLDTSVLIGEAPPAGVEAAISVASLTELHFGLLVATDDDERARRAGRLAAVEAAFDPLPVTVEVARTWGRLAAAVTRRAATHAVGRSISSSPRRRSSRRCRCSPTTSPTCASWRTSSTSAAPEADGEARLADAAGEARRRLIAC